MRGYNRRMDDRNPHVNEGLETIDVSFAWPSVSGPFWITVKWAMPDVLRTFGLQDSRWECIGLCVEFAPGARVRPLQATDLRRIRMGDVLDYATVELEAALRDPEGQLWHQAGPQSGEQEANLRRLLTTGAEIRGKTMTDEELDRRIRDMGQRAEQTRREAVDEALSAISKRKRAPATRMTDELLQEVALVYSRAQRDGRHPTKAVREHFGFTDDKAGRNRAAQWVYRARKAEKLPRTRQGEARGLRPRRPREDSP